MAKFIDLKEAASILGVTTDELVEMRSRGEIFGMRDGAGWKFKFEEVERVQNERSASGAGSGSGILAGGDDAFDEIIQLDGGGSGAGISGSSIGLGLGSASGIGLLGGASTGTTPPGASGPDDSVSDESVLLSEDVLGGSAVRRGSTIIGKEGKDVGADSDLKLAGDSGAGFVATGDSGVRPTGIGQISSSDVMADDELSLSPSTGSKTGDLTPKGSSGGELSLDVGTPAASGDDLSLDDSDEYSLADDDSISLDAEMAKKGPGSTGVGSDVAIAGGESGINIQAPSDSGLSLEEEPLELGSGSGGDLALPEDEDVIAVDDSAEFDAPTQLKADEDFALSPSTDGSHADDSDSGSQVIALDDSASFDQSAATMLNQGGEALVADEAVPYESGPEFATTGAAAGAYAGYVPAEPAEAPYSVWQVLWLLMVASLLTVAGLLMADISNYMWSFPGNEPGTTLLMDSLYTAFKFGK